LVTGDPRPARFRQRKLWTPRAPLTPARSLKDLDDVFFSSSGAILSAARFRQRK
jgi:hypothetical protein